MTRKRLEGPLAADGGTGGGTATGPQSDDCCDCCEPVEWEDCCGTTDEDSGSGCGCG